MTRKWNKIWNGLTLKKIIERKMEPTKDKIDFQFREKLSCYIFFPCLYFLNTVFLSKKFSFFLFLLVPHENKIIFEIKRVCLPQSDKHLKRGGSWFKNKSNMSFQKIYNAKIIIQTTIMTMDIKQYGEHKGLVHSMIPRKL